MNAIDRINLKSFDKTKMRGVGYYYQKEQNDSIYYIRVTKLGIIAGYKCLGTFTFLRYIDVDTVHSGLSWLKYRGLNVKRKQ